MKEKENRPNKIPADEAFERISEAFTGEVPPDVNETLRGALQGFRRDLHAHPYLEQRQPDATIPPLWGVLRPVILAGGALTCIVLIAFSILSGGEPTWADVVEEFESVRFAHAVLYLKEKASENPSEIEMWLGNEGRVRAHAGDQVVFAQKGKVLAVFDPDKHSLNQPDKKIEFVLEKMGSESRLSLDMIVRMFAGTLQDVTPQLNADAVISRDLVVFDMQSKNSPESMRIWALRESKLPIRIRVWDPSGFNSADVFLTYSRPLADSFFDPNAY